MWFYQLLNCFRSIAFVLDRIYKFLLCFGQVVVRKWHHQEERLIKVSEDEVAIYDHKSYMIVTKI